MASSWAVLLIALTAIKVAERQQGVVNTEQRTTARAAAQRGLRRIVNKKKQDGGC